MVPGDKWNCTCSGLSTGTGFTLEADIYDMMGGTLLDSAAVTISVDSSIPNDPCPSSPSSALTLHDATSVIFDRKWSKHLPVVGEVSVELKILFSAPSKFTFLITVQIAGRTFSWSKDVSGNISIPIKLVDGFSLVVDVAGWSVSAHQVSFDLLVKITGPFGISVTLFHQRVNIPLPSREEVSALASLDWPQLERLALPSALGPAATATHGADVSADIDVSIRREGSDLVVSVRLHVKVTVFGHTVVDVTVPLPEVRLSTTKPEASVRFHVGRVSGELTARLAGSQICARVKGNAGGFDFETPEVCVGLPA